MFVKVDIGEAKRVFEYDPETGVFTRKVKTCNRVKIGDVAGTICPVYGYRVLYVGGQRIRASRLAWAFMTGEFPAVFIDHINRNPADDRWANLRLADRSQNAANMSVNRNNRVGCKGVVEIKPGKFRATVHVRGASRFLGVFGTREEAQAAYLAGATQGFGRYATKGERP
jgi:hypothetical protein